MSLVDAVLITRPEPGATETAARVAAMGLTPIIAPVLDIRPLPRTLPPCKGFAAVLLVSGNAIDRLPDPYRALQTLTVGAATAARAQAAGYKNVTSADGDAATLAALVRARFKPEDGKLLIPAGRGQSQALVEVLRRTGYRVLRRVVYDAVPVARLPEAARVALMDDRTRTVLFFSAETARHFTRLVRTAGLRGQIHRLEAITIGAPAAMALQGSGWARIRVAGRPNQDEMLALLR